MPCDAVHRTDRRAERKRAFRLAESFRRRPHDERTTMPLLIGMDEAGYGPNLGPLVVTAVAWEVPGNPSRVDLWQEFAGIVAPDSATGGEHLQVADSKVVYAPARGLAALEMGVLAAIRMWRSADRCAPQTGPPRSFHQLRQLLTAQTAADEDEEPWYEGGDLDLPHVSAAKPGDREATCSRHADNWRRRCQERGIVLKGIRSAVVSPARFNARTRQHDSKGRALSEISMHLLAQLWQEVALTADESALIIADKHGGRNRYHEFLPAVFGDRFIRCREEGLELSRYQVGNAEIRFETKSERHLPVALASMVSKYVRELAMVLFNRFWTSRLPDLKPTAGYPADARRYRQEIAAIQRKLGITDDTLWRER